MPKIDLAKRRRIMQRSQKLGHCVCDPRKPCPCDVFRDQGICPCAGERPEPIDLSQVRLTELVHNAGCASKIAPADLEAVLSRLPPVADPAVLSGVPAGDDAAVYRLGENTYLVQTVDVMTPCCDDPYDFGRICAANCLSDIYAMGGVPRTALSILGFPAETLDGRIMYEMLRGAMEVLAESGTALVGGHSIKDDEIKLGFAVTGTVERSKLTERGTAAVGDVLVLTKPLGTGVLSFARQVGRPCGDPAATIAAMATLNRAAAEAAAAVGVSACTDVTGFGLFGHLVGMARHSGVTAEVWAGELPALGGAVEALAAGVVPGAVERNTEYVGEDLSAEDGADPARVLLGYDAQTSGGLLLSVPQARAGRLVEELRSRGADGWAIGRIVGESEGRVTVTARPSKDKPCCGSAPGAASGPAKPPRLDSGQAAKAAPCCAGGGAGHAAAAPAAFEALMESSLSAGAIDARTKELIAFALVVLARCESCIVTHARQARSMGITQQELDEAAWLAVAMGGAPVRMSYLDAMKGSS